jgi:hypothetical protein
MAFETNGDVLDWYERQPRSLTPEFISSVPWGDVTKHAFDERFVPVLFYMRDVETLTDMYHREMLRTPTGKDPHIAKFMERWGIEEITHGEVLNRFLNELGYESDEKWQAHVRRDVTRAYRANTYLVSMLTRLIGRKFTATHMTYGAIHELSTTQGYRRLMKLADHPVLTQLLEAIVREESAHTHFYWSVAKLELKNNEIARRLARFVIDHFWTPVGQGSLAPKRTEYLVGTLFGGESGIELVDKGVTKRIATLPGFSGLTAVTETVKRTAEASRLYPQPA